MDICRTCFGERWIGERPCPACNRRDPPALPPNWASLASTADVLLLREGLEIHCPHCHGWHVLLLKPIESDTEFTSRMLFWTCRGHDYYAGNVGTEARLELRAPYFRGG